MTDLKWLSAAECAARTGVTVRTLHVYEREGLLSPPRSANGWRQYGHAELARLSTITSLKELGFTLAQIRMAMSSSPPPLDRLLALQRELWQQRHAESTRALGVLARAESRLTSQQTLGVDELCELVKGLAENSGPDAPDADNNKLARIRDIFNETMSADERSSIKIWWAEHPGDLAQAHEHRASLKPLHLAASRLADQQADPASPEAQELVKRRNELLTLYGTRERMLRHLQWNPAITFKLYAMATKIARTQEASSLLLSAATCASDSELELAQLIRDVQKLMLTGADTADPASPLTARLVHRLDVVCRVHALGDAFVYVQWRRLCERIFFTPEQAPFARADDALAFIARAIGERDGRQPLQLPGPPPPPGLPAAVDSSHPDEDQLTPDEEYEWKRFLGQAPTEAAHAWAYAQDRKTLLLELQALRCQGVPPSAQDAQALAARYNIALLQHGVRELSQRQVAFNRSIASKVHRLIERSRHATAGEACAARFLQAALRGSSWGESLAGIHRGVQALAGSGGDPASPEAADRVRELQSLCRTHSLGDPASYARHAAFLASLVPDHSELVCGNEQTWGFLARALEAQAGQEGL